MTRLSDLYTGIVLKVSAHNHTIALLDSKLGHINAVMFRLPHMSSGALIEYALQKRNNSYFIVSAEIVEAPLLVGASDLYFLHHVLELCYYSVPLGSIDTPIFDAIIFLYKHYSAAWTMTEKLVFIFRLCIQTGFYSEHVFLRKPDIMHLYTMPIDKVFSGTIHLEYMQAGCVQEMHDWIRSCLIEHPYGDQFKTVDFFYKK